MLTEDQIRLAEAYSLTRQYVKRDEWVRGLDATITRLGLNAEDRSEFASRAGYSVVYGASTLGQRHPEVTHPSFDKVEHGLVGYVVTIDDDGKLRKHDRF